MRGETITLITRAPTGHDPGNDVTWTTSEETIDDVLIADGTGANSTDPIRPDGVTVAKTAYLPRTWHYHSLRGCKIRIDGHDYAVIGDPRPYDGGLTPTRWNLTVNLTDTEG